VSTLDATRRGRSALELIAAAAIRLACGETAGNVRRGRFRQWCDGVDRVCAHRTIFADYWRWQNGRALAGTGPLWVALGDSAAQGLGAEHPRSGYVGLAHAELIRRTGQQWRVLNLSSSGATIQDVIQEQLPRLAALPAVPDLVSCGVGINDLFRVPVSRVHRLLETLIDAVPDNAVMLDLPLPAGRWRVGRFAVPYVARVNSTIYAAAGARRLPVAYVSRHFTPPWAGKFGPDDFHPNDIGYRDWSRAVLQAVADLGSASARSTREGEQWLEEGLGWRHDAAA
jgi:acyl-CoA thioesterase-1